MARGYGFEPGKRYILDGVEGKAQMYLFQVMVLLFLWLKLLALALWLVMDSMNYNGSPSARQPYSPQRKKEAGRGLARERMVTH